MMLQIQFSRNWKKPDAGREEKKKRCMMKPCCQLELCHTHHSKTAHSSPEDPRALRTTLCTTLMTAVTVHTPCSMLDILLLSQLVSLTLFSLFYYFLCKCLVFLKQTNKRYVCVGTHILKKIRVNTECKSTSVLQERR